MDFNKKIAIISPVKNEIENLKELIASIEKQTYPLALWIIIDDNSDDGSSVFLDRNVSSIKNVDKVLLFHLTTLETEYKLGPKYSHVIKYGFERLLEYEHLTGIEYDFIGILDSDCTLKNNYYEKLIEKFILLPQLGIASGVIYYKMNNKLIFDNLPLRWARGAIRLWRSTCFKKSGYLVGNSADAISSALAWTRGWQSLAFKDACSYSRQLGARINSEYYGETAYFRYTPYYYVILKCFLLFFKEGIKFSLTYYRGYIKAKKNKKRIKVDPKVIKYFQLSLIRIFIENTILYLNNIKIFFKIPFTK